MRAAAAPPGVELTARIGYAQRQPTAESPGRGRQGAISTRPYFVLFCTESQR
jgi:hypothetical protein